MDRKNIEAALVELINAPPGQRPPALGTIARLMYPPRGLVLMEQDNGGLLVILFKWGYQYKHRSPRPKIPPPADCEGIRELLTGRFPGVKITVEDHGPQVYIFMEETL